MPDFGHLKKLIPSAAATAKFYLADIAAPGQDPSKVPTLIVVTTGEKNIEYTRIVSGAALQQAKQRGNVSTDEMLRRTREARSRFRKLAPKYVIKGWENVYEPAKNAQGVADDTLPPVPVPFSIDNCAELLYPEDFVDPVTGREKPGLADAIVDRLRDFCADDSNFNSMNAEVAAKN